MRIFIVLSVIILCGCASIFNGLHEGMYHEQFHQTYADKLDGWMERRFGVNLLIGDYYFKNGPRATIVWRMAEGYEPTIEGYKVYYDDYDNYEWLDKYTKIQSCEAW